MKNKKESVSLLAGVVVCAGAMACELPPGGQEIANPDGSIALSYRPDPAGLALDRQFSLIVHVCANAPIDGITVDAHMPDHRHGMNYKPGIAQAGPGAWRASGLLLHMPGKWEFVFGVRVDGKNQRLTHAVLLQ